MSFLGGVNPIPLSAKMNQAIKYHTLSLAPTPILLLWYVPDIIIEHMSIGLLVNIVTFIDIMKSNKI